MQFELDAEQQAELVEALDSYLGDMSVEIAHTDDHDFREGLKHRREVLAGILARLRPNAA